MQIKDAKKLKSIDAIDKEIIDIMKDLWAKKIWEKFFYFL
jgi:hypothetical protein